jgi:hypothetical protein
MLIVLVSLVGAMTLASGLLLLLEPSVPAGWRGGVPLQKVHQAAAPDGLLFDTHVEVMPGHWKAIVIHDSGSLVGSAETIDRAHRRLGRDGLGYHFVINNASGGKDGRIERGPRWRGQIRGAHSAGDRSRWLNEHAIGICVIGDFRRQAPTAAQLDRLVWLVQQVQTRLGIPSSEILLPTDHEVRPGDGSHFPVERVRGLLLSHRR